MFFRKSVKVKEKPALALPVQQSIEEAILLGGVSEIDDVLETIVVHEAFPKELRYGLEALRYFRAYYGPGKDLEPCQPLQKQKATVMEIAWGAELMDMLNQDRKIIGLERA